MPEQKAVTAVPDPSLYGLYRVLTFDNALAVYIYNNVVWVYTDGNRSRNAKWMLADLEECFENHNTFVAKFNASEIVVKINGEDEAWGPGEDKYLSYDRSIFLHLHDLEYAYIGEFIVTFTTRSKVVTYRAPIRDEPHPYVIDEDGRAYVLSQHIVLNSYKDDTDLDFQLCQDDYVVLIHRERQIMWNNFVSYTTIVNDMGLREDDILRFVSDPVRQYRTNEHKLSPQLVHMDGSRIDCTEEIYVSIMEEFMHQHDITRLDGTRLWSQDSSSSSLRSSSPSSPSSSSSHSGTFG